MHEPTQEIIVSELRRRVRVTIADVTQILGPQFASMIPQEIQRMKASGLVVYDEPLGPYSVIACLDDFSTIDAFLQKSPMQ